MMTVVAPKHILLIDDESSIREVVQVSLETIAGWEVTAVGSSREGLLFLASQNPDAILLDLTMPEVDGYTFLRLLGENRAHQEIPIILITAQAGMVHEAELINTGVAAIIQKPFNPLNLPGQITQILGWAPLNNPY